MFSLLLVNWNFSGHWVLEILLGSEILTCLVNTAGVQSYMQSSKDVLTAESYSFINNNNKKCEYLLYCYLNLWYLSIMKNSTYVVAKTA